MSSAAISLGIALWSGINPARSEGIEKTTTEATVVPRSGNFPAWWKEAVFYEVYPRSFKDSNGDGIGDLNGLIEKLDYLKTLGINAIWMTPHYDSPNTDSGYDIRDFKKIMKEYGTMADFDRLMAELKKRDMRLMIDVVINHTSDQNHWFVESRKSKDNPYRDYYFWRNGKNGGAPNNYRSFFGGGAWDKDPQTGQYYLHYFSKHQPDLNWDNPQVRNALYDIQRFWLNKGVSGLRFDTLATYSKIPGFPNLTDEEQMFFAQAYTQGPNLHRYIQEMHQKLFTQYDVVTAGELFGVPTSQVPLFFDQRRKELDLIFTFDLIRMDRDKDQRWLRRDWTLRDFKQVIARNDNLAGDYGWNTFFLSNHDNPRSLSHFGDDRPEWRERSAKALATVLLTQRATPFIFQGEELGMTNYPFKSMSDFDDLEAKGFWQDYVATGKVKPDVMMANLKQTSRDNARTPVQWDASANAGFTTGTPWLKVNPNYTEINAAKEIAQPDSIFNYYRTLIALRRQTPGLIYGHYADLSPENLDVYAYTRTTHDVRYLVVVNVKAQPVRYALPASMTIDRTLIESGANGAPAHNATSLTLQPWQSGIYRLNRSDVKCVSRLH
ncbi:glucohydrolase [Lonsdalea populi]|uniref:Alpha-glucosidase n=1 Tax=Lonsdalea populi TaxID=1172565 RepID=A0A3N0UAB7_9GAMM|nr:MULTISPECIES: alpha-glucosidase [Lonsdalea]OSM99723.1 glucohydrolase [Lonsdalea populi]QPQ25787.1 alpha-glucosidase [Lonsdalea populi]RAT14714.1 glucohydrolase [Lonsdalea quercina]RAT27849.1 glucohydrolase [Lonsdalea populi]RAT38850.1 glucohydrolase [Lonsdalea populi]